MEPMSWCLKQKKGIKKVDPSPNMSESYLALGEAAIGTMNREKDKNAVFSVSAGYYSMYYSLYSILIRLGIKCEIHTCSIKLMGGLLKEYFSQEEVRLIQGAFKLRNNMQYYVDRVIEQNEIQKLIDAAPNFLAKCKGILASINEGDVKRLRKALFSLDS